MQSKLTAIAVAAALSGAWLPALADTAERDKAAVGSVVNAPPPNYSDSMARLQEAAQRLREGIRQMAKHPPGEGRNAALNQAHKALFDTQQAMIQLPPELYLKEGMQSQPNYTVAMDRLQQGAQKLRESVHAMAQQPAGERRNAAMREAREAIFETQQAMIDLPLHMRSQLGAEIATQQSASLQADQASRVTGNATTAGDPGNGCWARLYDKQNFSGDVLSLVGPIDMPNMRTALGGDWSGEFDSVAVGPKARVTVYDNENYSQRVATVEPSQRIANLGGQLGFFEQVRSLKIACDDQSRTAAGEQPSAASGATEQGKSSTQAQGQPLIADPASPQGLRSFSSLDKDGDGSISRAEWNAATPGQQAAAN